MNLNLIPFITSNSTSMKSSTQFYIGNRFLGLKIVKNTTKYFDITANKYKVLNYVVTFHFLLFGMDVGFGWGN